MIPPSAVGCMPCWAARILASQHRLEPLEMTIPLIEVAAASDMAAVSVRFDHRQSA
jgi:hypothetical protein